jgi:hypothetical protein
MPHGEREMHEDILKYNNLNNILIIGNSINDYIEKSVW